ncbi:hypothetical protein BJP40_06395 [Streptomyces sp. CC53]|uniref:hypothetical protein n=1 Tax=Streptomyces sp. CC53 TaxID=1906740 RepID=UPI0008DDAE58|nr:hypothetical protein [Streptomyces sp. CC53]OII61152.1 hypothetical protein BJP40_06395 [Streptomyces sp. CC53]
MATPNQPGYEADFMEEGGKSFSFDGTPPISVTGIVSVDNPVKMQQRDFDTGDLLTWPDGNPKWQWRVDLQTELREAPDDDGMRSVYLKFRSKAAVVNAVKAAGVKRMERGGRLTLTYTSNDHSQPHRTKPEYGCGPQCQQGRGYPAKNYEAKYEPPQQGLMDSGPDPWAGMNVSPPPAAAPPAPPSAVTAPAPATAAPAVDPELVAFLVGKGIGNAATLDAATAKQIAAVYPDNPFK